jgi:hypothetical protein
MTSNREFYAERAADARRVADAASLDNVRERWLRSAAAWEAMSARAARTERSRAETEARKAAEAALRAEAE